MRRTKYKRQRNDRRKPLKGEKNCDRSFRTGIDHNMKDEKDIDM